ncbi:MAG: MBL fold metallo-hydrolase [Bacteroidia bacterium]|jgi:phosphoribosyl 1,2-cyclic phosphodiesterase|nr:MBL fold metallo-hydrolase [Bacteroidia bacterium]
MSLFTASLNSGSNGNCYYVGNSNEAVLIDAGISCRETENRMARLGLNINSVKAIFISHEHNDHIKGVKVLSKKYKIPVYITESTMHSGRLIFNKELVNDFQAHKAISIGNLQVIPFPKLHDAADPYSFVVKHEEVCVGVMTDIGSNCKHVINYFKQCHAVYLEANYDAMMLETGHYPIYLKRRISGDKGHLSNEQAVELFTKHRAPFLSHVFLSHLSKENNDPQIAAAAFEEHRGSTEVIVASRYKETRVFHITGNGIKNSIEEPNLPGVQTALF